MSYARIAAAALLSCTGTSATAFAEPVPLQAGVFVGGNHYGSESELGNSPFADQVPLLGAMLGVRLGALLWGERIAIESEFAYTATSTEGNAAMNRPAAFATLLTWRAQALYHFTRHQRLHPFASLGFGGVTFLMDAPDSFPITSPDTDYDIKAGVGSEYRIDSRFGARADLRLGLTPNRDAAVGLTYEAHAGVFVRFDMASLFGTSSPRGAQDSDGDGIPDAEDQCPDQAEIFNSIDDEDGCPEIDSDNDGLLGSQDQCPAAAEDKDGFEDEDGCPDLDNDQDGIPDLVDQCPLEAETKNGFEDQDGCADEVPPEVVAFTGTIEGIFFELASASIAEQSSEVLLKALAVLTQHPSVRIEISGHTDNQGSEQRNTDLSRDRAVRVKWFLVDRGIDASRIVTVGHGPAKPVTSNESAEGRAKNRRIEFRILVAPLSPP